MNTLLLEPFATSTWASSLGWTLLHSLWQGVLISGLLAALLSLSRTQTPQLRYALGVSALLVMLLTSVWTFSFIQTAAPESNEISSAVPLTETSSASTWLTSPFSFPAQVVPVASSGDMSEQLAPVLPWLGLLWMIGVGLFGLRVLGGWWYLHQIRRQSKVDLPVVWYQTVSRLAKEMGLHRIPEISGSLRMASPLVFGVLKPIVLIPVSLTTGMSSSQITSILAHELAHIQRQDYLINLLQSLVEALFFFHPAIWWISHRVREERELCCDDVAISVAGDAIGYARALAELESRRLARPHLAMPLEGTGSLMHRIRRLVEVEPQREPGSGHLFLALALTVGMGLSLWLSAQPQTASNEFFALQTFPGQLEQAQATVEATAPLPSEGAGKAVISGANIRMENGEQKPMLAAIGAVSPLPAYWSSNALVDTPPPPPAPPKVAVPAEPVVPPVPAMPEMPEMPNFKFHFDGMDSISTQSMEQFQSKWGEEMQAWAKEMEQWGKEFGELQSARFQGIAENDLMSEKWQQEVERATREGARHAAEAQREIEQAMREQQQAMREMERETRAQERDMRHQAEEMRAQEAQMRKEEERMREEEARMRAEVAELELQMEEMNKTLLPALIKDGFIKNKKDRITIKVKEGVWRINGTKLTPAQAERYQEILQIGGISLKEDGTVNIQQD